MYRVANVFMIDAAYDRPQLALEGVRKTRADPPPQLSPQLEAIVDFLPPMKKPNGTLPSPGHAMGRCQYCHSLYLSFARNMRKLILHVDMWITENDCTTTGVVPVVHANTASTYNTVAADIFKATHDIRTLISH